MIKVLTISKKDLSGTGGTFTDVEKLLKTEFKSLDYAEGFLDGYLFGKYQLMDLVDFECRFNKGVSLLDEYFIKFITINEETSES